MNYIILDLEATCWRDRASGNQSEIIEIGALKIDDHKMLLGEFSAFVKPKLHPKLSEFCTELTTIEQGDIDQAQDFKTVIRNFFKFKNNLNSAFCPNLL